MKKRFLTATVMMLIFLPLLLVPELFQLFQVLMLGLAILASIEMINMYGRRHEFPKFIKVLIVISTVIIYLSFISEYAESTLAKQALVLFNIYIGFIPSLLVIVMLFLAMMVAYTEFNGASIGRALTIVLYCGLGFGSLTLLRSMGLEFILYLFIITTMTDCFAYFFGMAFGKHKMSPNISPKKSWEGAIGGTCVATILGTAFALLFNLVSTKEFSIIFSNSQYMSFNILSKPVQIVFVVIITIAASVMGQIGDLVASKFKRTYDIKDYSDIFPGHGGVLDRLDSAIYVALFLFSVIMLFNNFAA